MCARPTPVPESPPSPVGASPRLVPVPCSPSGRYQTASAVVSDASSSAVASTPLRLRLVPQPPRASTVGWDIFEGTVKMSARVTAQARSTLAAASAPAVCTLGVVRPRNECGILLRKVQLVRHTSQSRNRAKSADTHTNNRRGYE